MRKLDRPAKPNITAFPTPDKPFDVWELDIYGQLRYLGNPTYLLLFICILCQLQTRMHSLFVLLFFIFFVHLEYVAPSYQIEDMNLLSNPQEKLVKCYRLTRSLLQVMLITVHELVREASMPLLQSSHHT